MRKRKRLLRVLMPGEPGTEDLMEQFGDALVCVRFWYDPVTNSELKTAEIVEHEGPGREPRQRRGRIPATLLPRGKR